MKIFQTHHNANAIATSTTSIVFSRNCLSYKRFQNNHNHDVNLKLCTDHTLGAFSNNVKDGNKIVIAIKSFDASTKYRLFFPIPPNKIIPKVHGYTIKLNSHFYS